MEEQFKEYEKSIKAIHKFGWTPKYSEKIRAKVDKKLSIAIAVKTAERLSWDIVFRDDDSVEVKRAETPNSTWTEKISIVNQFGTINIESKSLGNGHWDMGKNSRRVKLFIHAYEKIEAEYLEKGLDKLEAEIEAEENWDDYEIPEALTPPVKRPKPSYLVLVITGLITASVVGYLIAFLTFNAKYFLLAFEFGAGLCIWLTLKYVIRLNNFTEWLAIRNVLIATVILTYLLNQFFLYTFILEANPYLDISFFEFIQLRMKEGLTIDDFNTGWIGLILSWVLQLGVTYGIAYLKISSSLAKYLLDRVPIDVREFAIYLAVKEKSEDEIRLELSQKGWDSEESQNEVFESFAGLSFAQEMSR